MFATNMKNSCVAFLNVREIMGIVGWVIVPVELLYLLVHPWRSNNTEQYWNFNAERNVSIQTDNKIGKYVIKTDWLKRNSKI